MSEERLDRIEASLDRLVVVSDFLRTSVVELVIATEELRATTEALLQIATIHQQNFERLTTELNADRLEWRSQIERIWEYLQEERGNGQSEG